ncbi:Cysteine-rich venom protein ENH1 [Merluccius polli]|uniref:Cysteine-rich venom protein ENH1 n=1 Tax=Merluccius polli TaxID=89951 RepID=A0AA47MI05_MERPO|nr:Cysteine-rich venom protein ENH1 [Merluccius polli]
MSSTDPGVWSYSKAEERCFASSVLLHELCVHDTAIQTQITEKHNAFRRAVQPPAADMLKMNWSDALAASAQAWLDQCVSNHGPASSRTINGYEMGENLFQSASPVNWDSVITAWHNEVRNYKYPEGSVNGKAVGHYTQVVWNSSYQVGCGVAKCGSVYLYGCHYYRAGNFVGWPPYKLGPSCSSCPNNCEDKLCSKYHIQYNFKVLSYSQSVIVLYCHPSLLSLFPANPCPYINRYLNCPALKQQAGCGNSFVSAWCPAECKCSDKIIPIYRK